MKDAQVSKGPLAGVRVLDLTAIVLGPLATQILGDYGADVIKVEGLTGDPMRANGAARHPGMSSIYLAINRNKKSIAVDLKTTEGKELMFKLLHSVDVVVHNMRPAAMKRLGLDYDSVRDINPRLVYCAATGYGEDGPFAGKPVFDDIVQAACGLVGLIQQQSGKFEYAPTLIADKTAGLATANAILAALYHRERTGEGQYVEVPMFETLVSFTLVEHQGGTAFEPPLGPPGYMRLTLGGRRPTITKDGAVVALPYSGEHWAIFFREAGRPDLLEKYRLNDANERNARIKELYEDLAETARLISSEKCLQICEENDIPCTKIYSLEELFNHPHLKAVGLFERMEHPTEGETIQIRPATLFERTPAELRIPAPTLGQHTAEILSNIGISNEEIGKLLELGIIKIS